MSNTTVTVYVDRKLQFNLDNMKTVMARVLGHRGCPTCHSGITFIFRETDQFVVERNLEVRPLGGAPAREM
jgi:hypothetical protein